MLAYVSRREIIGAGDFSNGGHTSGESEMTDVTGNSEMKIEHLNDMLLHTF